MSLIISQKYTKNNLTKFPENSRFMRLFLWLFLLYGCSKNKNSLILLLDRVYGGD
jgi:hypothetical protein